MDNIKSELRFRYGGDLVVARAVLNDIAELPQMSNSDNPKTLARNIRFLSDLCCEAALRKNTELVIFDTTLGLQIIRNKLPRFIDTKWRRFKLEYLYDNPGTVHPTFKVFSQFLKNEANLLNFEGFSSNRSGMTAMVDSVRQFCTFHGSKAKHLTEKCRIMKKIKRMMGQSS